MGRESRLRAQSGEPGYLWKPAIDAPKDAWPLAICATLMCDCEGSKGGRIVVTGGRMDGHWVIECEHELDVTHYLQLPTPPSH